MNSEQQHTLIYAHDPMCSWCWGFKPTWLEIKKNLPSNVKSQYVLGGLAPDSSEPMPESTQQMLQQVWLQIERSIPGTKFNHDFWRLNSPRRSTYPSCRAVIAAKAQADAFEDPMIFAIQQAYYLHAKNPSNDDVLIALAQEIGCDVSLFKESLNSKMTVDTLNEQISYAFGIGAQGFPSLFFEAIGKKPIPIALSYTDSAPVLEQIDKAIAT